MEPILTFSNASNLSFFSRIARSVQFARFLLTLVPCFALAFVVEIYRIDASVFDRLLYALFGLLLAFGAFCHILLHLGYVCRLNDACRETITSKDLLRGRSVPCGFLIPSYREEPEYVFRAMLSAALQRNEGKWVRLLVDDPPNPTNTNDWKLLQDARALPARVRSFLEPFRSSTEEALLAAKTNVDPQIVLLNLHKKLAHAFASAVDTWPVDTADNRFFSRR